jgi:hypothetical protein
VTHRVVALRGFDRIVVLDAGRVVETGTFAELETAGGLFARMLALQRSMVALDDVFFPTCVLGPSTERIVEGAERAST